MFEILKTEFKKTTFYFVFEKLVFVALKLFGNQTTVKNSKIQG